MINFSIPQKTIQIEKNRPRTPLINLWLSRIYYWKITFYFLMFSYLAVTLRRLKYPKVFKLFGSSRWLQPTTTYFLCNQHNYTGIYHLIKLAGKARQRKAESWKMAVVLNFMCWNYDQLIRSFEIRKRRLMGNNLGVLFFPLTEFLFSVNVIYWYCFVFAYT